MTNTIKYLLFFGFISIVQASNNKKTLKQLQIEQKRKFDLQRRQQQNLKDNQTKSPTLQSKKESQHIGYLYRDTVAQRRPNNNRKGNIMSLRDLQSKHNDQRNPQLNTTMVLEQQNKVLHNLLAYSKYDGISLEEIEQSLAKGKEELKKSKKQLKESEEQLKESNKEREKILKEKKRWLIEYEKSKKETTELVNSNTKKVTSDHEETEALFREIDKRRNIQKTKYESSELENNNNLYTSSDNEWHEISMHKTKPTKKDDTDNTNKPIVTKTEDNQSNIKKKALIGTGVVVGGIFGVWEAFKRLCRRENNKKQ